MRNLKEKSQWKMLLLWTWGLKETSQFSSHTWKHNFLASTRKCRHNAHNTTIDNIFTFPTSRAFFHVSPYFVATILIQNSTYTKFSLNWSLLCLNMTNQDDFSFWTTSRWLYYKLLFFYSFLFCFYNWYVFKYTLLSKFKHHIFFC